MYPKVIVIFFVLLILLVLIALLSSNQQQGFFGKPNQSQLHQCGVTQCTAACGGGKLDNLSDPAYNMKEVIKQCLLLEDHLIQKEKRCRDCIAKHFLTIQAYLGEMVWLAGDHVSDYPLLPECISLFSKLFDEWLNDQDNVELMVNEAGQIRDMRKRLVAIYYTNAKK